MTILAIAIVSFAMMPTPVWHARCKLTVPNPIYKDPEQHVSRRRSRLTVPTPSVLTRAGPYV